MVKPNLEVSLPDDTIRLLEPVHSEARSRRWRALGQDGARYEVLFVPGDQDPGPLLAPEIDEGICGWDHIRGPQIDGHTTLVFREDQLQPLSGAMTRQEPWSAARRFEVVLALGELFEMLHVIGEALVIHGNLEAFGLRQDGARFQVVMRWPELLYPSTAPPTPGSLRSYGLDAPEVTGQVVRPLDQRADVFMLGVLTYALLTGVLPSPGLETLTERLPLMRAFDPQIPLGVERCVRRAIARTPEARHPSVTDFLQALRQAWAQSQDRALVGEDKRVWLNYASVSAIGRTKRTHHPINQDAHLEVFDPAVGWGFFGVMDGVSRSDVGSGEMASWVARTTAEAQWNQKCQTPIYGRRFEAQTPFPTAFLGAIAHRAHERVLEWLEMLRRANPDDAHKRSTLATTFSAMGLFGDRCALCTVGDSPVYLIRLDPEDEGGSSIELLSAAQNEALFQMRQGVAPAQALGQPGANWLAMAVGKVRWEQDQPQGVALEPELWSFRLKPGDLLLLSSDGVPDAFGSGAERAILEVLEGVLGVHWPGTIRSEAELTAAARALVREADARGGRDNLTAILVAVGPPEEEP